MLQVAPPGRYYLSAAVRRSVHHPSGPGPGLSEEPCNLLVPPSRSAQPATVIRAHNKRPGPHPQAGAGASVVFCTSRPVTTRNTCDESEKATRPGASGCNRAGPHCRCFPSRIEGHAPATPRQLSSCSNLRRSRLQGHSLRVDRPGPGIRRRRTGQHSGPDSEA